MYDILVRAGCFITIILLGILLRRVGYFKEEDFHVLSKIVIRITLTAAIITNFSGRELEYSMLILTLIGFLFGASLITLGIVTNYRRGNEAQAFAALNSSGVNIGNFTLPFAISFLGPVGVMAVSLFDVGNSFICLGGSFSIAALVKDKRSSFSLLPILKNLSKSIPLMTYVTMTLLSALHLSLPHPVVELAGIIGSANAFLAMLMIGVGFKLSGNSTQRKDILRIVSTRYAFGIACALLFWFVLPFPLPYRQALVLCCLGPVASAAPAFTAELKSDFGLASAVNSITIVISIFLITGALLLIV